MLKKLAVNISLVVASIMFCALIVELTLRFAFPVYAAAASSEYDQDNLRIWAPRANRVSRVPHPDTGVAHLVIQNELALRQSRNFKDLSGAVNLAFFGDSYTANNGLPSQYSFTEPLDYLLNRNGTRFNVLNYGVNGYGTDQAYLYYKGSPQRGQLHKVFYLLCANDLRNIYESNLFSLDESGALVRNPVPPPAWWIRPLSRLHLTYLVLDLRQRLLHAKTANMEDYRAIMQSSALKKAYQKRFHDRRAVADCSWKSMQFKRDGHWAEEGNRLAAVHLYQILEPDLGLAATSRSDMERALFTYYSAFPKGWMPEHVAASTPAPDELARIRKKYLELELRETR